MTLDSGMWDKAATVWGDGQLLCYSGLDGEVLHGEGLVCRTRETGETGLTVCLPAALRIRFGCGSPTDVRFRGDSFQLVLDGRRIRGVMPDARHLLLTGIHGIDTVPAELSVAERDGTALIGLRDGFDAVWLSRPVDFEGMEQEGTARGARGPSWLGASERAAYRKAVSVMRGQVYSPQGRIRHRWTTPDRWPHRDMWLWDSAFHAIGWRHLDAAMARETISAVFDFQREDGFVAHQMNPNWQSQYTQPPLLAYAVRLVNDVEPDPEWVAGLYPRLAAYLAWDVANRDRDGDGLLEWTIDADANCRCGESGMDNSPRFDDAWAPAAPDFNAMIANEYDGLAELAETAGRGRDANGWRERADEFRRLINARLWDDERGFYFDRDPGTGRFSNVTACSGFIPLLCGAPDEDMAARMVAHLRPGGRFDSPLPVASVAPDDPTYARDMWRGPSWLNLSWLIAEGLDRYEYHEDAKRIRGAWRRVVSRDHGRYGTLFEYYDEADRLPPPELTRKNVRRGQPLDRPLADYGWTATLYVDLCCRREAG